MIMITKALILKNIMDDMQEIMFRMRQGIAMTRLIVFLVENQMRIGI